MGKPVISTVFNGACEIMTDGVHGFVLSDPRDVKMLGEKYAAMMDEKRRGAMGVACLGPAEEAFAGRACGPVAGIYGQIR